MLMLAVCAAIAACRRGVAETASGSKPYDLRECIRRQLRVEGFSIEAPYPTVFVATTAPASSPHSADGQSVIGLSDGSQVDRLTVWFGSGLQVQGETRVRDRDARDSHGMRLVPNSARLTRTIEKLNNLCPAPAIVTDTSAAR